MKRRRVWLLLPTLLLPALVTVGGCKKEDDFEKIETPPVDVDALRREAQERKRARQNQPPPAPPGDASQGK